MFDPSFLSKHLAKILFKILCYLPGRDRKGRSGLFSCVFLLYHSNEPVFWSVLKKSDFSTTYSCFQYVFMVPEHFHVVLGLVFIISIPNFYFGSSFPTGVCIFSVKGGGASESPCCFPSTDIWMEVP